MEGRRNGAGEPQGGITPSSLHPDSSLPPCLVGFTHPFRAAKWIELGVDTGAAWPLSATYGKWVPGDVDRNFRTANEELVKAGKRLYVEGCAEHDVYNIYRKPKGNETDAMPLYEASWSSWLGPNS